MNPKRDIPPEVAEPVIAEIRAQLDVLEQAMAPAVDCELSDWTLDEAADAGPWTPDPCPASGQQTRDELWRRMVLIEPENGGAACGALVEARVGTRACTPPGATLLQAEHLVYEGAFRVPTGTGTLGYGFGGTALAYHPARDSLYMTGHDWYQRVGEFTIPEPRVAGSVSGLLRAVAVQPPADLLAGKRTTIDGDIGNGVKIGGLIPLPSGLVVSAWSFYDAGAQKQTRSHFLTKVDFAGLTAADVSGPFQVGTGFQFLVPTDTVRIAGFVSGYMCAIPAAWQTALGGTHLTGNGGGISILNRTSSGPAASVFTPGALGAPTPATMVLGYPTNSSNPTSPLHRPTLGVWGQEGGLYNGTQCFRGMVFPEGTRSVLFIGWGGSRFCYGAGTADPALDLQPHPNGGHWCYDPTDVAKGTHGHPNTPIIWAYDVEDFIAVKEGRMQPWQPRPYATWAFSVPFLEKTPGGLLPAYHIVGAAYRPASQQLLLACQRQDGDAPLIHVFRVT